MCACGCVYAYMYILYNVQSGTVYNVCVLLEKCVRSSSSSIELKCLISIYYTRYFNSILLLILIIIIIIIRNAISHMLFESWNHALLWKDEAVWLDLLALNHVDPIMTTLLTALVFTLSGHYGFKEEQVLFSHYSVRWTAQWNSRASLIGRCRII